MPSRVRWYVVTDMMFATGNEVAARYVWGRKSKSWVRYKTDHMTDPRRALTYWTKKLAEADALMIVIEQPSLIGKVRVESFDLYAALEARSL